MTQVEFFIDDVSIGVDSVASDGWSIEWDTTGVGDGSHTLKAVATNASGGTGSADVTITVDNLPDQILPKMHVGVLSGTTVLARAGKWNATVTVTIHDASHGGLSGAEVSLMWSDGLTAICTTGSTGTCTVTRNNIGSAVPSLILEVTNVTLSGTEYDPTLNEMTSFTVNKPK